MPSLANVLVLGAITASGLLAANNVFGDASEARDLAAKVVCGRAPCDAALVWHKRGPVHQEMQFTIDGKRAGEVLCQRVFWLVGSYDCYEVRVDGRNSDDFRF